MNTNTKLCSLIIAASMLVPMSTIAANCPNINGLAGKLPSNVVGASFDIVTGDPLLMSPDVVTYNLDTMNRNSVNGVPGVIAYCIYPADPPGNPTSAIPLAIGANGTPFDVTFQNILGFFDFSRHQGNPTNVPLDGRVNYPMGTANWPQGTAPTQQTILIHINDAEECNNLYGGDPGTCFVFPGNNPPPQLCNGNPACKQVVIDEAITSSPLTVPAFTELHIHYTYTIVNQPTNTFNMIFYAPTPKTKDINSGGGKDHFGCEQIPDPAGQPGDFGLYPNYQGKGWVMDFTSSKGKCNQSRLTFTSPAPEPIVLMPGESVSWTVDMVPRKNASGKFEYTSTGTKILNSGFTVKWFQSNDDSLHSFSTSSITVNAVTP